jgi:hypothetical protein
MADLLLGGAKVDQPSANMRNPGALATATAPKLNRQQKVILILAIAGAAVVLSGLMLVLLIYSFSKPRTAIRTMPDGRKLLDVELVLKRISPTLASHGYYDMELRNAEVQDIFGAILLTVSGRKDNSGWRQIFRVKVNRTKSEGQEAWEVVRVYDSFMEESPEKAQQARDVLRGRELALPLPADSPLLQE